MPYLPASPWAGPSWLSPILSHSRKPPAGEGARTVRGDPGAPNQAAQNPSSAAARAPSAQTRLEVNFS